MFRVANVQQWKNPAIQKQFLDNLGLNLRIRYPEDWYEVTYQDIQQNGGEILLQLHKHSTSTLLRSIYPQHSKLFRYHGVPSNYWKTVQNRREYFDWVAEILSLNSLDDWYGVSKSKIQKLGGDELLRNYFNNSLREALEITYKEHNWLPWKFDHAPKASQY
jgi:hypothetical protein